MSAVTPEARAEAILTDLSDNNPSLTLMLEWERGVQLIAVAINLAVAEDAMAWRRRFLSAFGHEGGCAVIAKTPRCTCGAHDRQAELQRELAAAARR